MLVAPLPIPLPPDASRRVMEDGPNRWSSTIHTKDLLIFLQVGSSLVQHLVAVVVIGEMS